MSESSTPPKETRDRTTEDPGAVRAPEVDDAGPPPTPFDHPLFLPVLLAAFSVWFGYDAYLNDDPDLLEHLAFNRFGLRVMAYLTAVIGYQGLCELKGRPASPWIVPGMLAVMTLWFAYDGWMSQDALNLEYQSFIRHAAVCLAIATVAFAVATKLRVSGRPEPFFALPLVLLGFSVSFGLQAERDAELLVADLSACAGLGVMAVWLAQRLFRDRRAARD